MVKAEVMHHFEPAGLVFETARDFCDAELAFGAQHAVGLAQEINIVGA